MKRSGESARIENERVRYVIGEDGRSLHFIDRKTGKDHCLREPASPFARVRKGGMDYGASSVSYAHGLITVEFGESGVSAVIEVSVRERHFVLEVVSVSDESVEELVFADIRLALKGSPEESFAACALALNLQTNVPEIPGPSSRLRASCYPRFGFAGARVAIIACARDELRRAMQEVVSAAEDLPRSEIGGPWALDAPANRGSYLFNFGGVTEETVGDWIELAGSLGFTQLDFHGGRSFRHGDCRPDPDMYPQGLSTLKAVIDRLHEAGIQAGLHTYAFFMDKRCPWVTPAPDPRLGKDATFTLAEALTPEADAVPVVESTKEMSTTVGFFVRNSVTLQIDDELVTYSGVSKERPRAFTGCERGACGTRPAPHATGARVHHLKECFGLFAPDGDSTLLAEVAERTAETFNECGFDMIYLDALDGEDVLGGPENGWHYGSKFVFELWKRLKKPALMEMSTFHHHLWFVRSRMGAWDHPRRSHKRFIDLHCAANEGCRRMFLPAHLGWWALLTRAGPQEERTFPDDVEYLCCKCIGMDAGFSLMGIDPGSARETPALSGLATIIRRYETLRHADRVPEPVKARLKEPGAEFALVEGASGEHRFRPVQYAGHKVEGIDGRSSVWKTRNRFGRQPVGLRIEALMSAGPYDAPDNVILADFAGAGGFDDGEAAPGVTVELRPSSAQLKAGPVSGRFSASRCRAREVAAPETDEVFPATEHGVRLAAVKEAAWAKAGKEFRPPLDLSGHEALGVWVHGDGKGEVLNFQVKSPEHVSGAMGDHYVIVDFEGWRYFELIEPEGERCDDYSWPYGHQVYHIYREDVDHACVGHLNLWFNNIPPGETATCHLSPVRALPLVRTALVDPSVTVGGGTIVFPVEIESGCYLEFCPASDCRLYDLQGGFVREVALRGEAPTLEAGENEIRFACGTHGEASARARVTVISRGEPFDSGGQRGR